MTEASDWARVTVRVWAESSERLKAVALKCGGRIANDVLLVDVSPQGGEDINSQLAGLPTALQSTLGPALGDDKVEVEVLCSWTPRTPQDGLVLSRKMIEALASANAEFRLDVLSE